MSNLKIKGYKIKRCPDGNVSVDIKRKQVSVVFLPFVEENMLSKALPDRYYAVSYNDEGYAVSDTQEDIDLAIQNCIKKATNSQKAFNGLPLIKRNAKDEYPNNSIYWWEKGYRSDSSMHYKCEHLDNEGKNFFTGVGDTLEQAIESLKVSMDYYNDEE